MLTKLERAANKRRFIIEALKKLSLDPEAKSYYVGIKPHTFTSKDIATVAKDLAARAGLPDTFSSISISAVLRLSNENKQIPGLVVSRNNAVRVSGIARSFLYSYSITPIKTKTPSRRI